MSDYGLSKIEVLVQRVHSFNGGFNRELKTFENATFILTGDYLVVTEHKNENETISKVLKLDEIYSYKITNNNEEN